MNTTTEAGQEAGKTKLFKSKKELIALAVAATVFAFVIYRMYFSKAGKMTGPAVAQLNSAAVQAVDPAGATPVQAATEPDPLRALDLSDDEPEPPPPSKLERDPFKMSTAMHEKIYDTKVASPNTTPNTSEPVTLTRENAKGILAGIPGAKTAAASGLKLEAIMHAGDWKAAVVNGRVVQVDKTVAGFTVVDILEDSVILKLGKHRVRLILPPPGAPVK